MVLMSRTHSHARIGSQSHRLRPNRDLPGRRWAALDYGCHPNVVLLPFFWMPSCSTTCIVAIFFGVASTWDCAAPSTDSVTDPRLDRYSPSPRESQGHTNQHTLRARSRDLVRTARRRRVHSSRCEENPLERDTPRAGLSSRIRNPRGI
ncbi:uncharacterized protein SCHCODRAFT_02299768 [Schizophyllum commune H4-8]|uniref:uncharacterized protein n=1 Tax=Schizophyllum commune (strain H4-8 / FGSC 9210) TaxID=578458 RepID=UPI00215DD715|nr:uncharacterized protein SCHCODRAFT_02299768 [Schizophyllum commune H4-8]KAI5892728.1 hypothetical protein SCHCODRAFT_02299768 [Schizophyllum commune H4-8]